MGGAQVPEVGFQFVTFGVEGEVEGGHMVVAHTLGKVNGEGSCVVPFAATEDGFAVLPQNMRGEFHWKFEGDSRIFARLDVEVRTVGFRDAAAHGFGLGELGHGHFDANHTVFPGNGTAAGETGLKVLTQALFEDGEGKEVYAVEFWVVVRCGVVDVTLEAVAGGHDTCDAPVGVGGRPFFANTVSRKKIVQEVEDVFGHVFDNLTVSHNAAELDSGHLGGVGEVVCTSDEGIGMEGVFENAAFELLVGELQALGVSFNGRDDAQGRRFEIRFGFGEGFGNEAVPDQEILGFTGFPIPDAGVNGSTDGAVAVSVCVQRALRIVFIVVNGGVEAVPGVGLDGDAGFVKAGEAFTELGFGGFQEGSQIGIAQEGSGECDEEDFGFVGVTVCGVGVGG